MTGGSTRSLGPGLSDDNSGRDSSAKDLLLTSSKRRTTRPVRLSVFNSSGTRSEENIPLMQDGETAFTEHDSAQTEFVTNEMAHSGRLRTSSLTSDVSSQNSKVDSGNSSLICSSSTDSYPDFESGSGSSGRSRTASSSKSEQNLTSKCPEEYDVSPERNRGTSTDDSASSSSSEKVSLSSCYITETSDELVSSAKNCQSSPVPPAFDTEQISYAEAERRLSTYFSASKHNTAPGSDSDDNSIASGDCRGCTSSPVDTEDNGFGCATHKDSDVFNSTVVYTNPNATSGKLPSFCVDKKQKRKTDRHCVKSADCENERTGEEFPPGRIDGMENARFSGSRDIKGPLLRTASLGYISLIPKGDLNNSDDKPTLVSSELPVSAADSEQKAAPSRSNNTHNSTPPAEIQYHSQFPTQPYYYNFSSYPATVYPVKLGPLSPVTPPYPVYFGPSHAMAPGFLNSFERGAHSITNQNMSPPLIVHPQVVPEGHVCSRQDGHCRSPFMSVSQTDSAKSSSPAANVTHKALSHTPPPEDTPMNSFVSNGPSSEGFSINSSDVVTSVAKIPCQDLESVLGYGTPVSPSALKTGTKCSSSADTKPLQVLVPKAKETPEEINQIYLSKKNDPLFPLPLDEAPPGPTINSTPTDLQANGNSQVSGASEQADPSGQTVSAPPHLRNDASSPHQTHIQDGHSGLLHPSTAAAMRYSTPGSTNQFSEFACPDYSQHPLFMGQGFKAQHPASDSVQAIGAGPGMAVLHGGNNQVYIAPNSEYAVFSPVYGGPYMTHDPNSMRLVATSNPYNNNAPLRYPQGHLGGCKSEPIYTYPGKDVPGNQTSRQDQATSSNGASDSHTRPLTIAVPQDPDPHHHRFGQSPPTVAHSPLTVEFAPNPNKPSVQYVSSNQTVQLGRLARTKQHAQKEGHNPPGDGADVNGGDMDENGYRAGMLLRVPRSCFEPDFLDSQENLGRSRRESVRQPSPCSIDSGHVEHNQGSLPRSDISQLGLLKGSPDGSGHCSFINREIPDYRLLCFVATIFNPLLGAIALVCNRYARRNYRLQSHTRANYLYIATILISTVAIFLTLVGVALLIARTVVLKADDNETASSSSVHSCHNRLFGHDDSLKNFYNLDLEIYCEIIKNERVLDALINYWITDAQTKKEHLNQNQGNASDGTQNSGVDTNQTERDMGQETNNDNGQTRRKFSQPGIPELPENNNEGFGLHNTVVASDEGPFVPPGLEMPNPLEGEALTETNLVESQHNTTTISETTKAQEDEFINNTSSFSDGPSSDLVEDYDIRPDPLHNLKNETSDAAAPVWTNHLENNSTDTTYSIVP